MELREKVCIDKMRSRALREKVSVDKMGSGAVQQQQHNNNNHHGPRQSRFRAILVFRGVVVGVAKANHIRSLNSSHASSRDMKHASERDFRGGGLARGQRFLFLSIFPFKLRVITL